MGWSLIQNDCCPCTKENLDPCTHTWVSSMALVIRNLLPKQRHKRPGFEPWVGMMPWRRDSNQSIPVDRGAKRWTQLKWITMPFTYTPQPGRHHAEDWSYTASRHQNYQNSVEKSRPVFYSLQRKQSPTDTLTSDPSLENCCSSLSVCSSSLRHSQQTNIIPLTCSRQIHPSSAQPVQTWVISSYKKERHGM